MQLSTGIRASPKDLTPDDAVSLSQHFRAKLGATSAATPFRSFWLPHFAGPHLRKGLHTLPARAHFCYHTFATICTPSQQEATLVPTPLQRSARAASSTAPHCGASTHPFQQGATLATTPLQGSTHHLQKKLLAALLCGVVYHTFVGIYTPSPAMTHFSYHTFPKICTPSQHESTPATTPFQRSTHHLQQAAPHYGASAHPLSMNLLLATTRFQRSTHHLQALRGISTPSQQGATLATTHLQGSTHHLQQEATLATTPLQGSAHPSKKEAALVCPALLAFATICTSFQQGATLATTPLRESAHPFKEEAALVPRIVDLCNDLHTLSNNDPL
ncbi:hypothetical protein BKA61DRAFT_680575 [Leptodontidium sp. MPI-SDFR-AT-0119]|nr:hypothetical protein BKA61DRAFT_680575 [Leptodontidium sp. MPI-SDFR-AT-0119]